ncbi:phage major capsid protein [Agrobacterium rhizogenes]|uniref:phage major capsid protein n=1 Tax=Rhizobium rhizogenes TaxID=359 RepID=UPI001573DA92|nr:phage major capsid protein [Rhizobium rhizogenes]NTI15679.1 phage major capsid protein [Rhizobium rhizogenes]
MNLNHAIENRAAKLEALKALGSTPDQSAFNALETEIRSLDVQIQNARKIAEFERQSAATPDTHFATETRAYNLMKAVREAVEGPSALTGLEREAHQELQRAGHAGEARSILVPMSVLFPEQRVSTVANPASAGNTVFNQYGNLIDRNRIQPVVQSLGANLISGLEGAGDLILPRNVSGPNVTWSAGETDTIPDSDATYDNVVLSGKSAVAEMRLSNKLVLQNSVSLQQVLSNDLAQSINLAIDKAAIAGTGLNGQPSGILKAITQSTTTETDWSKIVADLLGAISIGNDAATGVLISTALMNQLRKTAFDTTGQPIAIADLLHGFSPAQTNQLATLTAIAANWQSLLVGVWGGFRLLVDPYSLSSNQQLKLVASATVDVAIRHPESFAWKTVAGS